MCSSDLLDQISDSGVLKPLPTRQQPESMSVEQLKEVKIQLQSRPKSMRAGGTIKIGDVVRDMNST